jgi:hypothetical protein
MENVKCAPTTHIQMILEKPVNLTYARRIKFLTFRENAKSVRTSPIQILKTAKPVSLILVLRIKSYRYLESAKLVKITPMLMRPNLLASLKHVMSLYRNIFYLQENVRNVVISPILMRLERFVFLTSANKTKLKTSKENAKNVKSTFILTKKEKLAFRIHAVKRIMNFFKFLENVRSVRTIRLLTRQD